MALRIKPRHLDLLELLLDRGRDGEPADLLVGRMLPVHDLATHGFAEQFIDPNRVATDRWRLTHTGGIVARFLLDRRDAA